jgi:CubicO group peptidase (beta-lactamase class C family)
MPESVVPEEVGLSSDRVRNLEETMQAYVDGNKVAGLATLIAHHSQVVHQRCYGNLDVAGGGPVQTNSIFRLGSLTKPITAVAALMLHEKGGFDLHDPVSRWIPEFKNLKVYKPAEGTRFEYVDLERPLTFWHLLTHTAGFGYGIEPDDPVVDLYRQADFFSPLFVLQLTLPEMIHRLSQLPLANQPGEAFRYSISYDVLGYLIELISGQPLAVYLRERIFEPLGMFDTGFGVPSDKLDRFSSLYSRPSEGGILLLDDPSTSRFVQPQPLSSGGGGLVSTLLDYFCFLSVLLNGGELNGTRLLEPVTVKKMITSRVKVSYHPGMGYGFGVGVQVEAQQPVGLPSGVFGWDSTTGSEAWTYLQGGLITVIMYQSFVYREPAQQFRVQAFGAGLS